MTIELTTAEILAEFRDMLTRSKTQGDCDECLDWAWGFLPAKAAEANTAVIQEVSRKRKELRAK